jgi:hypothetical protein
MITSPINPMRYWKLEEIQRMLNAIEGYENVVIEFQYQQSDDWTKRKVWECKCGVKEQLVNGQYNWLLKYVFAIEANDEGDARTIAWQEAAERLVTDVWKNSIHSFRKEQRDLNKPTENNKLKAWGDHVEEYSKRQKQLHEELANRKLMEIELENTTTNKTNNTIQTQPDLIWAKLKPNKTWWTETKLWTVSSIVTAVIILSAIYFTKTLLIICLTSLAGIFLGLLVAGIYVIIKEVLGLDDK